MESFESVNSFPFRIIRDLEEVKHKGARRKKNYADIISAFDIETTTIESDRQAFMYIWQMQIGDDHTVIGRTWAEFRAMIAGISECLPEGLTMVIFVHNLSYEFQFMKSIIQFDDVFAMDNRKVLTATYRNIEFRCSYLLSNMNLEKFVISAGGKYRKQSGYDYRKKRYPWTAMSDQELKYCIYDVKALVSAIENKMKMDGDTLVTLPKTSTGYVRRIFKEIMRPYRRMVRWELPDLDVFNGLRKAFRGGNTHANRYASGLIISDVYSYDISSSYPSVLVSEYYPSRFESGDPDKLDWYMDHNYAALLHINLYDVQLLDDAFGCPYLAKAKCGKITGAVIDNGRILGADALMDVWITEIDLQIITGEYKFNYEILDLYVSKKKKLPHDFRAQLIQLYKDKTELKGIDDYSYSKAKNQFNSAYGMSVQNPCKPDYVYKDGMIELDDSKTMQELIDEYHKTGWLPYQIGVWCTAYARQKLEAGLQAIDYDRFIYADTDSIKLKGNADQIFQKLNRRFRHKEFSAVDPAGKRHYLGIFEPDGYYQRFITMGAKKYAYEDESGQLHVTVSGVNKKTGAEELGKLENFREGFVFRKAGGLEAVYNDFPQVPDIVDGPHRLKITSNVALVPSTYTLGITYEYKALINFLANTDIRYSLHYER